MDHHRFPLSSTELGTLSEAGPARNTCSAILSLEYRAMDDLGRDTNDPEVEPVKQRLVKQRLVKHVLTRIRRFLPMNMEDQDEECK